ncbi:MAG: hypothetical protein IKG70_00645 [Lachnospiraceae bacterium]|nr:hypothetical protein [Lachnospiraceae bacterium]
MLNYDEELKKFKPIQDVDDVEGAIYGKEMIDVIDLLREMKNVNTTEDVGNRE